MKVTFIGLGIMGSRMAANLLKNKVDLTVFNRSLELTKALEKAGAQVATSITEAVENADIVITMLANPEAVSQVILQEGIAKMKKDTLWIDCSTVNPSFVKNANRTALQAGISYLEAPVAGTKPQAENAELVFFVGGEKSTLEKIEYLLNHMGNKVVHIGAIGKGASFKMLVNMQLAMGMLAFSESIKLGESLGLDKTFLLNAIPNLPVSAPFTKMKAENIRNDDWEPFFPLELMLKDLHLATLSGYEKQQPLPFTNAAKELFALADKDGMGREDMAAIYKLLST